MEPNTIAYFRRYSFPFVATAVPSYEAYETNPSHIHNIKIYNYVLTPEELENERPFMNGRKQIAQESELPIPSPVHVRDILSDEELENERPFMRGRVKVSKEILRSKLQAKSKVYNVLSDEEWENEKPFMHGRNRIPKGERRYLQIAPVLIPLQRENEQPFMAGRNKLPKEITGRIHQRQLVDLCGENEKELGLEYSTAPIAVQAKNNSKKIRKRHLCTPCQALSEFRKKKILPAVKNMHVFLVGRKTSASEKLIPRNDGDGSDHSIPIIPKKYSEIHGDTARKTRNDKTYSHLLNLKAAAKIYKEEDQFGDQLKLSKYNKYRD